MNSWWSAARRGLEIGRQLVEEAASQVDSVLIENDDPPPTDDRGIQQLDHQGRRQDPDDNQAANVQRQVGVGLSPMAAGGPSLSSQEVAAAAEAVREGLSVSFAQMRLAADTFIQSATAAASEGPRLLHSNLPACSLKEGSWGIYLMPNWAVEGWLPAICDRLSQQSGLLVVDTTDQLQRKWLLEEDQTPQLHATRSVASDGNVREALRQTTVVSLGCEGQRKCLTEEVVMFPVPPLEKSAEVLLTMAKWLGADEEASVLIVCDDQFAKTVMLVSLYLVWSALVPKVSDALLLLSEVVDKLSAWRRKHVSPLASPTAESIEHLEALSAASGGSSDGGTSSTTQPAASKDGSMMLPSQARHIREMLALMRRKRQLTRRSLRLCQLAVTGLRFRQRRPPTPAAVSTSPPSTRHHNDQQNLDVAGWCPRIVIVSRCRGVLCVANGCGKTSVRSPDKQWNDGSGSRKVAPTKSHESGLTVRLTDEDIVVNVVMRPPTSTRRRLPYESDLDENDGEYSSALSHLTGDLLIRVFADYQCPHCSLLVNTSPMRPSISSSSALVVADSDTLPVGNSQTSSSLRVIDPTASHFNGCVLIFEVMINSHFVPAGGCVQFDRSQLDIPPTPTSTFRRTANNDHNSDQRADASSLLKGASSPRIDGIDGRLMMDEETGTFSMVADWVDTEMHGAYDDGIGAATTHKGFADISRDVSLNGNALSVSSGTSAHADKGAEAVEVSLIREFQKRHEELLLQAAEAIPAGKREGGHFNKLSAGRGKGSFLSTKTKPSAPPGFYATNAQTHMAGGKVEEYSAAGGLQCSSSISVESIGGAPASVGRHEDSLPHASPPLLDYRRRDDGYDGIRNGLVSGGEETRDSGFALLLTDEEQTSAGMKEGQLKPRELESKVVERGGAGVWPNVKVLSIAEDPNLTPFTTDAAALVTGPGGGGVGQEESAFQIGRQGRGTESTRCEGFLHLGKDTDGGEGEEQVPELVVFEVRQSGARKIEVQAMDEDDDDDDEVPDLVEHQPSKAG